MFTTSAGWKLIVLGQPDRLLLRRRGADRSASSPSRCWSTAMSARPRRSPPRCARCCQPGDRWRLWGLIVAVLLLIGSLPALHRACRRDAGARSCHLASLSQDGRTPHRCPADRVPSPQDGRHHVADFPVSLFYAVVKAGSRPNWRPSPPDWRRAHRPDGRLRPRLCPDLLVRPRDMPGAKPALGGVRDRWNARPPSCNRRAADRTPRRPQIDPRLRLEVAGDLGTQDRIPREIRCGARDRPSARCCRSRPARSGIAS